MNTYDELPRTISYKGTTFALCGKFGKDGHLLAYVKDYDFSKCLVSSNLEDKNLAAEDLKQQLIALNVLQP